MTYLTSKSLALLMAIGLSSSVRCASAGAIVPTSMVADGRYDYLETGSLVSINEYEDAFMWLREAMVSNVCYRSAEPNVGLELNAERATLKCYSSDTGLLIGQAFSEKDLVTEQIHRRILCNFCSSWMPF